MANNPMPTEINNNAFYAKWANVPFAPAKCPFFYGWVIVAVSTLSIVFSIPGQTAGIGVFTDYLIESLGITRNQLSLAYMIGTITSGLILPFAGKLLDRLGVRFMSLFACIGLAVSVITLSFVGRINGFFTAIFASVWVPVFVAAFAFLLVRFFGQGNMTMVGRVAMARWFNHWRGIATAISGVPVSFAFSAAPWILNELINYFGWRQACWVMAGAIGVGMTLLGLIFFRDTPEDCGLKMDGVSDDKLNKKQSKELHKVYRQFTRPEAVRDLSFWAFALGLGVHGLIVTAVSFHITSIGLEMGKSREDAILMFFYSSFIAIPVRFTVSYFVDNTRLRLKWVLMMMSLAIFGYTFGLAYFNTLPGFIITIATVGTSTGIWGVLCSVSFPRYFGRKHLGAISGLNMSVIVVASAIGPAMFSYGKQWLGSYRNAVMLVLVLPAIIFLLSFFVANPQRKIESNQESAN